jgi:nucleotide-binding universal stress UspA family protein
MFRCVLAPVDGSDFGERALPLAVGVASRAGATLHLVHVQVPVIAPAGVDAAAGRPARELEESWSARDYLQELRDRLRAPHCIEVTAACLHGPVAPTLERYAFDCGAGLVVMSTHAHSRFSRIWRSSVAEHVSRNLPVPVLLTRCNPQEESLVDLSVPGEVRHLLVPLDGRVDPAPLLSRAMELGRPFGARYTLLRVVEPGLASLPASDMSRSAALQYLNAYAERMRADGLDVRTRVIVSDAPADTILAFVFARNTPGGPIDCVAMEAHPHGSLRRLLGTHTVDVVLRDTPVPVLLFEPSDPSPREERITVTSPRPDAY